MFRFLSKIFGTAQERAVKKYRSTVEQVNQWAEKYKDLTDDQLREKTADLQKRIQEGETLTKCLPEAYGIVKDTCRRLCGTEIDVSGYNQKWDMIPYDVQIIGGIAMHEGSVAEMMTGEGKTLTASMPLFLAALTGKPVHLVTVNDYLAERDCQWVGCIFRWHGLTTATLTNDTPTEKRAEVYKANIVYGTASEFGFDYLRDNSMVSRAEDQVQRGHYFAIIDEIDSILIDEARTPLIISGPAPSSKQMYDELKGGVATLVKLQRDFCSSIATKAKKVVDSLHKKQLDGNINKEEKKSLKNAFRDLWLVSKGTPRNKVLKRVMEDPDCRSAIDEWSLYFYNEPNKDERAQFLSKLYMIIDEKSSDYELTDKGISAWVEKADGSPDDFVMLDLSEQYLLIDENPEFSEKEKMEKRLLQQDEDAKRKERAHNLRQLLRAHLLMEKDVDYLVIDGKIVIVDENTGRPQPGRRFSDGLHQSIEAKEGVKIQRESQTYATITLQNYFRMYDRLAGMTGTAGTEANEFKEIYKLSVLEIPTYKPCIRDDANDEIYMTEREKYAAIIKDVKDQHEKGRPILVGTESVEVSEKLSRILKQADLPHTVLNAKNHANEAEVIAAAGQKGAITVSTNMAGRGTDIKLGKGVPELGGLYVMGISRHQARRIDRQLRGRSARLGDPGSSKFYVSFEDSLMRLFASPKLTSVLQRFRPPEGEPISANILNKSIETAQKRVEQRNYMIRKHTLQYDDVMNKQRQEVYAFRNDVLHQEDVEALCKEILYNTVAIAADQFFVSRSEDDAWDPEGFRLWLSDHLPISFAEKEFDQEFATKQELQEKAYQKIQMDFEKKFSQELQKIDPARVPENTTAKDLAWSGIRDMMLHRLDALWQEHLLTMDHLRSEVGMRAVGQRDPLTEFKHEAFRLFDELSNKLNTDIAQDLFRFEVVSYNTDTIDQLLEQMQMEKNRSFVDDEPAPRDLPQMQSTTTVMHEPEQDFIPLEPITEEPKIGRNDLCPCGSGKKYKKCCGATVHQPQ